MFLSTEQPTPQFRLTARTLTGPIAAAGMGLLLHCQRKGEAAKSFLPSQLLYLGHGLVSGKCSAHTQGLGLGLGQRQSLELHVMWSCQATPSKGGTGFIRILPLKTSSLVWLVLLDDSPAKASV